MRPVGNLSGGKWDDANGNGQWDTDEVSLAGVTIYLDTNNNGVTDRGENSTQDAADGLYEFADVAAGTIYVREVIPNGFTQTWPREGYYSILLKAGNDIVELNFGNVKSRVDF